MGLVMSRKPVAAEEVQNVRPFRRVADPADVT